MASDVAFNKSLEKVKTSLHNSLTKCSDSISVLAKSQKPKGVGVENEKSKRVGAVFAWGKRSTYLNLQFFDALYKAIPIEPLLLKQEPQ